MAKKQFKEGLYWYNSCGKEIAYLKKTGWGYHTIMRLNGAPISMSSDLLEDANLEPISINNQKDLISLITEIKELKLKTFKQSA